MEVSKKTSQQFLIGTGLLLIVPMLIFPSQFGTELAKATWVNVCYELVVYGIILYFVNRRVGLLQLARAATVCLAYRLTLGAIFGALISFSYSMDFLVSLQLGTLSYLPAILFQIALTPVVLMPGMKAMLIRTVEFEENDRATVIPQPETSAAGVSMSASRERGVIVSGTNESQSLPVREPISRQTKEVSAGQLGLSQEITGFDRAVRYIGEHGAVQMAAVVDHEGLLLARYSRSSFDPEDYAPLARMLFEINQATLIRSSFNMSELDRIDLGLKKERLVVCKEDLFSVLIIAERQSDDLLNIRINQGLDIINKYVDERYGRLETSNVEKKYVSGTE